MWIMARIKKTFVRRTKYAQLTIRSVAVTKDIICFAVVPVKIYKGVVSKNKFVKFICGHMNISG